MWGSLSAAMISAADLELFALRLQDLSLTAPTTRLSAKALATTEDIQSSQVTGVLLSFPLKRRKRADYEF
jgi:hypothetical protein